MDRPALASPSPETTPSWAAGVRRRLPFYLVFAFLLAVLAGILTFLYLDRLRVLAVPSRVAVVARQEIRPGTLVDASMVEARPVPEGVLPTGALTSPAQAIGRVAAVPLVAGEILLSSRFTGGDEGLSSRLPDGRWALVLPSAWMATPLPALSAGDRLDLLGYLPGSPIDEAGVIVTAVEVLETFGDPSPGPGLALAVTLEQASAVAYARGNGFLILPLLRPRGG
ncbi:MAG TPA: Flp pilus assembly protein CpaB [Anaerolineales bacterium]|nr:Flp pilus assembly protein CpaB [Anaerolineales bacterium]